MQGRPIRDSARHLLGENPFAPGFGQRKVLIDSRNSSIPISIGFDAVWPVTGGLERASAIFFAMGHNRCLDSLPQGRGELLEYFGAFVLGWP
jgi:hypothetical protein